MPAHRLAMVATTTEVILPSCLRDGEVLLHLLLSPLSREGRVRGESIWKLSFPHSQVCQTGGLWF